ncbi:MAG: sigma-54-dependent transcriptional regulator [Bradymonadaceae bacterium]
MTSPPTLLLVEDDGSLREVMAFNLGEAGYEVVATQSGAEALRLYDPTVHDVVITDLRMPGIDGLEVLRRIRGRNPRAVVLVLTAYGSVERAIDAMQQGAFHYVEKPVNTRALQALVARALEYSELARENARLHDHLGHQGREYTIISASPAMNEVLRLIDKVAESDVAVLIRGESGTGKELVARALHERSLRRYRPFVAVNCAALPDSLLESLLFGHEKGAFTGASRAQPGKFRAAEGGTIFLDEIAEMSPHLQSKLLRVLQDGEVEVIGASQPIRVDVRVVAATHQDLHDLIQRGSFREDLFYRLNVVPIEVPPLRQRREDIPVLLRYLIRRRCEEPVEVERGVDELLLGHDWPGNVRELQNIVTRMLLLMEGKCLRITDVPAEILEPGSAMLAGPIELPFGLPADGLDLMELEKAVIVAVLRKMEGNQSATARYLNIPRHVLLYRLEKYGIGTHETV